MQLISKFDEGIGFLCAVDIVNKYTWVIPLKYVTVTNAF